MKLMTSPGRIARILLMVFVCLLLLHLGVGVWRHFLGHDDRFGIIHQFSFDRENNAPTYFSALLLLVCAALLAITAIAKGRAKDPFRRHWTALSVVFAYMSADEVGRYHEMWPTFMPLLERGKGIMHFPWIPVGIVVVALFSIAFLRFLLSLQRRWKILFFTAGVVYISGALGLEAVCGLLKDVRCNQGLMYAVESTAEETLEMWGAILFIYSLLSYMHVNVGPLEIYFTRKLPDSG